VKNDNRDFQLSVPAGNKAKYNFGTPCSAVARSPKIARGSRAIMHNANSNTYNRCNFVPLQKSASPSVTNFEKKTLRGSSRDSICGGHFPFYWISVFLSLSILFK